MLLSIGRFVSLLEGIIIWKGSDLWWKKNSHKTLGFLTECWAQIFLFLLDMLTVEFTKMGDVVGVLLKKVTKTPSSRDVKTSKITSRPSGDSNYSISHVET